MARLQPGRGFFRPESRPSRDLGVLLARRLAERGPLRVLDAMAGCGIRGLRYGREAGAAAVWVNDADPDRLPLLEANLAGQAGLRCTALTAQHLLAGCLQRQERFELVDLDAFGCPAPLLALALEAVACDGALYLASTDGRSPTGHDRPAAVRKLGRGLEPLFSFSEGRTFRTAVRLRRRASRGQEAQLGMVAHCHGCGDQQVQELVRLRQWQGCLCPANQVPPLAISGPLWIGPLQDPGFLAAMAADDNSILGPGSARLLAQLAADPGLPARCWPTAELGRRLGCGPPPLADLVASLRTKGWLAEASGVMPGQLRSDAPWGEILQTGGQLVGIAPGAAR